MAAYSPPFANEPSDYKELSKGAMSALDSRIKHKSRFQAITEREDRTDWPKEVELLKSKGKYLTLYRGCEVIKCPEDFVTFHQLFYYTRPAMVIELGTYVGGMAIWIADQLKLLDVNEAKVYSMDIDTSQLSDAAKKLKPDNVTYLQGDSNEIEKTFTPDLLSSLPHPWVVIEDAHANMSGVLRYFHQFLQEGDYFVVEDTNPNIGMDMGCGMGCVDSGAEYELMGRKQLDCLKGFLQEYEEFYSVDSLYTDLFGYNSSWHWHGYIRRMK